VHDVDELCVLGVSFRTAPVAVRESLRFNRDEAAALLGAVAMECPDIQALVLSTCNRSEFYLAMSRGGDAAGYLLGKLRKLRPHAGILHVDCQRYQFTGMDAARHLFGVACGLDSAILGDVQILGQVKDAMRVAGESGTLGRHLEQAVIQALKAAKRARTETAIGAGAASLGSAIANLIAERESSVTPRAGSRVLIVGAGDIARDIGRNVGKGGHRHLSFINRTLDKARAIAEHCGGIALPWHALPVVLHESDFVITATSASIPILSADLFGGARSGNGALPLVIDAGVPRNVAAGVPAEVLNIDAIRARQDMVLAQRLRAVPAVERIIGESVIAWERWLAARPVEAALKTMFQGAAAASRLAAAQWTNAGHGSPASEQALYRSLNRALHSYARQLRSTKPPVGSGVWDTALQP
jgi:glutamyl-tRNA reductase